MSSMVFVDTVTNIPADWANDVNIVTYGVFGAAKTVAEARTALGLDTLALQSKDMVDISGGSLNGVRIGNLAPVPSVSAVSMQVSNAPLDANDVVSLGYMQSYVESAVTSGIETFGAGLGSLSSQDANNVAITAGTLESVTIGANLPGYGRFNALKVLSNPTQADDAINLGWMDATYGVRFNQLKSMAFQAQDNVDVTGGQINGVTIGNQQPAVGTFSTLCVNNMPSIGTDAVNKAYVDTVVGGQINGLGTMAYQNANLVAITGGQINGTAIGASVPSTGAFTALSVSGNTPILNLVGGVSLPTQIGINLMQGTTQLGGLMYYNNSWGTSALANRVALSSASEIALVAGGSTVVGVLGAGVAKLYSGSGVVLFGNVSSPGSEKVQIVGGAYADKLMSSEVRVTNYARQSDGYHLMQIDGGARARSYAKDLTNVTATSTLLAIDLAESLSYRIVLDSSTTLSFLNQATSVPSADLFHRVLHIFLVQGVVGGKNVAWPSNVLWSGGVPPDFSTAAANKVDIIELHTIDNGATWYAFMYGANASSGGGTPFDVTVVATTGSFQQNTTTSLGSGTTIATIAGGTRPYSVQSVTGVPPGMSIGLAGAVGDRVVLYGTPSTTGTFSISYTIKDAAPVPANETNTFSVTITPASVPQTFAITTDQSSLNWVQGTTYPLTQVAHVSTSDPGMAPYSVWQYSGLPPGVSLQLSGTNNEILNLVGSPTSSGSFSAVLQLQDNAGAHAATDSITITVAATTPSFSVSAINTDVVLTQNINYVVGDLPVAQVSSTDTGVPPYSFLAVTGLPDGMSLAFGTGGNSRIAYLVGTPTVAATFNGSYSVADSLSRSVSLNLNAVVNAAAAPSFSATMDKGADSGIANVNNTDSVIAHVISGVAPYAVSVISGAPAGLSLYMSGASVYADWQVATPGVYNIDYRVSDAQGRYADFTFQLTIEAPALTVSVTPSSSTQSTVLSGTFGSYATASLESAFDYTVTGGIGPFVITPEVVTYFSSYGQPSAGLYAGNVLKVTSTDNVVETTTATVRLRVVDQGNSNSTTYSNNVTISHNYQAPVIPPLVANWSVTASPLSCDFNDSIIECTNSFHFTGSASGGTAPYSYSWTNSGVELAASPWSDYNSVGSITVSGATTANYTLNLTSGYGNGDLATKVTVTVTDANNNTAVHEAYVVSTHNYTGGGADGG